MKDLTAYERKAFARIMKRIIPVPESGCWIWTGLLAKNGYGSIKFHGKGWRTHRAMWLLMNGHIPDGLCILHSCDVPACVRPEHLHLGTPAENIQECIGRDRYNRPRGEKHVRSKLTEENVRAIRNSPRSCVDWARELNVSSRTVNYARNGRNWSWLS